jgi:hypothetical protein
MSSHIKGPEITSSSGSNQRKRKREDKDESLGESPPKIASVIQKPFSMKMFKELLNKNTYKVMKTGDCRLCIVSNDQQTTMVDEAEEARITFKNEISSREEDIEKIMLEISEIQSRLINTTEEENIDESEQLDLKRLMLIAREHNKQIKEIKSGNKKILLPNKVKYVITKVVDKSDCEEVSYPDLVKIIKNTPKRSGGMDIITHRIGNGKIEKTYTRIKKDNKSYCFCEKITTGKITVKFKIIDDVKKFCFSNYCSTNKYFVNVYIQTKLNSLDSPFGSVNETPLIKNDILVVTIDAKTREITYSLNGGTEYSHAEKIPQNNTIRPYFDMGVGGKVRISYTIDP